jgi:hypothetical protein
VLGLVERREVLVMKRLYYIKYRVHGEFRCEPETYFLEEKFGATKELAEKIMEEGNKVFEDKKVMWPKRDLICIPYDVPEYGDEGYTENENTFEVGDMPIFVCNSREGK